jgi:hypothetical protein
MARYLERIAARARMAAGESAAAPRARPQLDGDGADPFEATAHWSVDPTPPPADHTDAPVRPAESAPLTPRVPAPTIIDARVTEVRMEGHRVEITPVAAPARPTAIELTPPVHDDSIQEITLQPPTREILEREFHTETVHAESATVRETVHSDAAPPARIPDPEAVDDRAIEHNVLMKLMPALDAWFASNSGGQNSPHVAPPAATPAVVPRARDADTNAPAASDGATLVIGSIHVEVAQAAVPAPPAPPTPAGPRTARVRSSASPSPPSRLRFGLGQI